MRSMLKLGVLFLTILTTSSAAEAQFGFFRSWTSASGGSYSNPFNWNPLGVPNANDGAGFALDATYTVAFPSNETTGVVTVSDGSVTFDMNTSGTARTLNIPGTLTVGSGTGALAVTDGVVNAGNILVEDASLLTGTFTASINAGDGDVTVRNLGSNWTTQNGFLRIGENGVGNLLIEDGGFVFNNDGTAIGRFAGSDGTATVTDANSKLEVDANLTIGQEGTGTLMVVNGAEVESAMGRIAFDGNAVGSATVSGANSTWTNSSELRVGESGDGTLLIEAGGSVSNTTGTLGFNADSLGTATVTGTGSTWNNTGELSIGEASRGTLTISAGGHVSATNGSIRSGGFLGPASSATVTGEGSQWSLSGELGVGGALDVESGGSLQVAEEIFVGGGMRVENGGIVTSASGRIIDGSVTVTDIGSKWDITGGLTLAGSTVPIIGGPAILNIPTGGAMSVGEGVALTNNTSFVFLDGGTLTASTMSVQAGQFDFVSGILHVEQFNGALINQGGTLAPGASAGSTEILFDYEQQADATLQIELGGTDMGNTYDFVDVVGNALLDGQLELALIDGFFPDPADEFVVFDSNSLTGAFANVANNVRLTTSDGSGSFLVHYGVGSPFNPDQIVLSDFEAVSADTEPDGDVDGADFLAIQRTNPALISLWEAQFGSVLGVAAVFPSADSGTAAVPEPTSANLALLMFAIAFSTTRLRPCDSNSDQEW